jgi:hypothetical protein
MKCESFPADAIGTAKLELWGELLNLYEILIRILILRLIQ